MSDFRQNGANGAPDAEEKAELYKRYRRARAVQADWWGDKVASVSDETLAGEHDPNAARVALHGYMWAAARMAPKTWGERVEHEVSGTVAHVHGISASGPAAARLQAMLAPKRVANEAQQRDEGASDAADASNATRDANTAGE